VKRKATLVVYEVEDGSPHGSIYVEHSPDASLGNAASAVLCVAVKRGWSLETILADFRERISDPRYTQAQAPAPVVLSGGDG
jgi:hypothetical protein